MAPKRALKRSELEVAQQPPAKKGAKGQGPENMDIVKYRPVLDAIDHPLAEGTPEPCKQMLKAMVPFCLGILAGERHPHQEMVVKMLGEVIEGVEAAMQNAVAAAETRIAEIDASRPYLDSKVQDADAALAAASAAEDVQKAAHDSASQGASEAKAAVSNLQSAAHDNEASHKSVSKEKETLEMLLVGHVQHLKTTGEDGSWNVAEMKKHANHVIAASKKLRLEDSLVKSIPATVAKRPSERSSFDNIVFQQLEAYIQGRLKELDASLSVSTPELAKHTVDLEKAREELEEKNKAVQLAASELKAAKVTTRTATASRAQAVSTVENFGATRVAALEARDAKLAELAAFRDGGLRCYRELRSAGLDVSEKQPANKDAPLADRQPELKSDAAKHTDEGSKGAPVADHSE